MQFAAVRDEGQGYEIQEITHLINSDEGDGRKRLSGMRLFVTWTGQGGRGYGVKECHDMFTVQVFISMTTDSIHQAGFVRLPIACRAPGVSVSLWGI